MPVSVRQDPHRDVWRKTREWDPWRARGPRHPVSAVNQRPSPTVAMAPAKSPRETPARSRRRSASGSPGDTARSRDRGEFPDGHIHGNLGGDEPIAHEQPSSTIRRGAIRRRRGITCGSTNNHDWDRDSTSGPAPLRRGDIEGPVGPSPAGVVHRCLRRSRHAAIENGRTGGAARFRGDHVGADHHRKPSCNHCIR